MCDRSSPEAKLELKRRGAMQLASNLLQHAEDPDLRRSGATLACNLCLHADNKHDAVASGLFGQIVAAAQRTDTHACEDTEIALALAGATFVKLDCEGAELELLARFPPGAWRGVRRLVFEWSFTKERRMSAFRNVVARLEDEGFVVTPDGRDGWDFERWPWHTDALVFAARDAAPAGECEAALESRPE